MSYEDYFEDITFSGTMHTDGNIAVVEWKGNEMFRGEPRKYYEDARHEAEQAIQDYQNSLNKTRIRHNKAEVRIDIEWTDK